MKRITKKIMSFLLAAALVLVALPYQMISNAETTEESVPFNLLSGNSEFRHITNWGKVAVNNGQLNLDNGKYVYYGYELGTETVKFIVNHNGKTSCDYWVYLHTNDITGSNLTANGPIAIKYDSTNKEFWLWQGTVSGSYDSNNAMAKMSAAGIMETDTNSNHDHTVEIITAQNAGDGGITTTLQLRVDGNLLKNSKNNDETCWTFEGVQEGGYISFTRYSGGNPIIIKGLYIEGITYDPYYTENFTATFEDETSATLSIKNPASGPTASVSADTAYGGTTSVKLNSTGAAAGTVNVALGSTTDTRALRPGVTYRVTAWVKRASGSPTLDFNVCRATSRNSVSGSYTNYKKQFSWWGLENNWATLMDRSEDGTWYKTLITSEYTVPEDKTSEFPYVSIYVDAKECEWYIDNITFEAVMEEAPATSEDETHGSVSYTNYISTNTAASTADKVAVCVGDTVTVSAAANAGYYFIGWYLGNTCVSTSASYTYVADGTTRCAHFAAMDNLDYTESIVEGFEDSDEFVLSNPASGDFASLSTAVAHSGSTSVYIDNTGSATGDVSIALTTKENAKALKKGATYRVTAWVKSTGSKSLKFTIKEASTFGSVSNLTNADLYRQFTWWGINNNWTTLMDQSVDGEWSKIMITSEYTVEDDYTFPVVVLYAETGGVGWYIDDVAFEEIMENEPVASADETKGSVSYTNFLKLHTGGTTTGIVVPAKGNYVEVCVGDSVTAKATPKDGYKFTGWYKGDTCVSTDATYTYITDGTTLYAHFDVKTDADDYNEWDDWDDTDGAEVLKADFETTDGLSVNNPENGPKASFSTAASHSGTQSYYVDDTSSTDGSVYVSLTASDDTEGLIPGVAYRITAWVKGNDAGKTLTLNLLTTQTAGSVTDYSGTGVSKQFNWWGLDNNWATLMDQSSDGTWRKVLISGSYTAGSTGVYPILEAYCEGGGKGWYIDDVVFEVIMDEEPAASANTTQGTVSYKNYLKLNSELSVTDKVSVCVGDSVTAVAKAAKGYRFSGWYKGDTCVSTSSTYTYVTDGTTIYAQFSEKPVSNKVNFTADFESASGLAVNNPANGPQATLSTDAAHSGTTSMWVGDTGAGGSVYFSLNASADVAGLKAGVTYRITAWIRGHEEGKTLTFNLLESTEANSLTDLIGTDVSKQFSWWGLNNNWATLMDQSEDGTWCKVLISGTYTVSEDGVYPVVEIYSDGGGKGWYIDDIAFEEIMTNEPVATANAEQGMVSYTNYLKLNSELSETDKVTVCVGDSITASAKPALGYRFTGWYKGNTCVSTTSKYTYVTDGATIYARFEESPKTSSKKTESSKKDTDSASKDNTTSVSEGTTKKGGDFTWLWYLASAIAAIFTGIGGTVVVTKLVEKKKRSQAGASGSTNFTDC